MFEQSQLELNQAKGSRKSFSLAAGFLLQSLSLSALFILSLMFTEAAPRVKVVTFLMAPPAGRPHLPRNVQRPAASRRVPANFVRHSTELVEPTAIPETVAMVNDPLPPSEWQEDTVGDPWIGVAGGTGELTGAGPFVPSLAVDTPPPPVEPEPLAPPNEPLRIGGEVAAAKLMQRIQPVYPKLAIQTRTQGTVRLEAVIDEAGRISNLRVVSGHPLLIQAALDAVAQWRYQPTLLNGSAVAVITTIEVTFRLGGN